MKDTKTGRFKMILSPQYCKWMRVLTNLYRRFTCPQPQVAKFCGFDYKCLWNTSKCQILFLFVGKYFLYFLNVTDSSNINMNSAFQSLSHVWLFATPWTTVRQAFLSFTIPRSLLNLMFIWDLFHVDPYNYVCTNILSWLWQFHTEHTRL